MDVGNTIPIPDMSACPMFPNGNDPPAMPPGVEPMEPNEMSLPPEELDEGKVIDMSTKPLTQKTTKHNNKPPQ
jgi:hypothetical protein